VCTVGGSLGTRAPSPHPLLPTSAPIPSPHPIPSPYPPFPAPQRVAGGVGGKPDRVGPATTGVGHLLTGLAGGGGPARAASRYFTQEDFRVGAAVEFAHSPGQVFLLESCDAFTAQWTGAPPSAVEGSPGVSAARGRASHVCACVCGRVGVWLRSWGVGVGVGRFWVRRVVGCAWCSSRTPCCGYSQPVRLGPPQAPPSLRRPPRCEPWLHPSRCVAPRCEPPAHVCLSLPKEPLVRAISRHCVLQPPLPPALVRRCFCGPVLLPAVCLVDAASVAASGGGWCYLLPVCLCRCRRCPGCFFFVSW
jgi:hypothetical protein